MMDTLYFSMVCVCFYSQIPCVPIHTPRTWRRNGVTCAHAPSGRAGLKKITLPLHMRVQVYRTRAITSVVYGRNAENEPVSCTKMADYSELVSYSYLRSEAIIRKTPHSNTSQHDTETASMSSLSLSCASRR